MAAKYETIRLSQIAGEVEEMASEYPALQPGDEPRAIVVEIVHGNPRIVDGFHRAAGFCRWATEHGQDYADVLIRVLVADDEDLIADAAEPGPRQDAALDALYSQAD